VTTEPSSAADAPESQDLPTEGSAAPDSKDRGPSDGRGQVQAINIQNFKKIREARIPLGPITYLVGGNNSGKSSVLQAIHTAVSCAQVSVERKQRVVAEANLRYSPVADFSLLGHGVPYYEKQSGTHRGIVEFEGQSEDSDTLTYSIQMYKARNHSNVGVDRSGDYQGFGQVICDPKKLFSVYVPGLAGVPHREELNGFAAVFRKAASGDANLVFRNIIRLLAEREQLRDLEALLFDVLKSPVAFRVSFDPDRDLYVDVQLAAGEKPTDREFLPVDLWGTGVLQITQIFAYVLLFRPALLLVDEPDSHLHASRQKSLAMALERVAKQFDCKVIVSTHSRHLITAASESVQVVWMKDGGVESSSQREVATLLMDLGALDQLDNSTPVILYTEDKESFALERALEGVTVDGSSVTVESFDGINNSWAAHAFRRISDLLDSSPRVLVHRDRDFLTPEEVEAWAAPFEEKSIEVFCPELCDTEAYLASVEHIAGVTGMDEASVVELRAEVIESITDQLRTKHRAKRQNANKEYKNGGSPKTSELWPEDQAPTDEVIYGKLLLTKVTEKLRQKKQLGRADSLEAHPCVALRDLLVERLSEGGHSVVIGGAEFAGSGEEATD
jgi:ABC-type cobalamin/Fe3+-siderophores transport system ATPase subunit